MRSQGVYGPFMGEGGAEEPEAIEPEGEMSSWAGSNVVCDEREDKDETWGSCATMITG